MMNHWMRRLPNCLQEEEPSASTFTDSDQMVLSDSRSLSLCLRVFELTINFVPTAKFLSFALPNLLYLTACNWFSNYPDPFISAPILRCLTLEDIQFNQLKRWTSSLVDYHSISKYLVVKQETSISFECPNLKVIIFDAIKLDSTVSLFRLLNSLSQCVELQKLALAFTRHNSVSMQPLINLLSGITGLSHLKLTSKFNTSPDSISFEQEKFPSLSNLNLDLSRTNVFFSLDNSFTSFTLSQCKDADFLELKGPSKNYFVRGHFIQV